MTILVVEDNLRFREVLLQLLKPCADAVYECEDGREAITLYDTYRPDLVLMDIRLKDSDGIATTREIVSTHPQARVVIVTDYADAELRDAAREAGAVAYYSKENLVKVRDMVLAESRLH
jgi:CheY-like chemotaxis protein